MKKSNNAWNACGFTLIELLVVLVIMGILVGMVTANAQPSDRDQLRVEAERLAQIMDMAAEESRITGATIAWSANATDYRFWRLDMDDEWSEIRDSDLLRARRLPPGMVLSNMRVEAGPPSRFMRVQFSPGGSALAFVVDLSLGSDNYVVASSPMGDLRVSPGKANQDGGRDHR